MFGIYIHVPFCKSKCKYCDFVSGAFDEDVQKRYFASLENEMHFYLKDSNIAADTVFFGGGTPSFVDAAYIRKMLETLHEHCVITNDAEISVEANPGTVTAEKAEMYADMGINRISVGLQSDDDALLEKAGRTHTAGDFESSLEILAEAGFKNINVDIMYGLPGQTESSFAKTAEYVSSLPVTHVSAYSLKIEEGTPLFYELESGSIDAADEDTDRNMYHICRETLASAGFYRYEISNFAKIGYECRHNLKYWTLEDYIGFGAAAHSFYDMKRYGNAGVAEYIEKNGICRREEEILSGADLEQEFMMLGLRLQKGISISEYEQKFGRCFEPVYGKAVRRLVSLGFIKCGEGRVFMTEKGMDVQNSVLIALGI